MNNADHYCYIIEAGEHVKIGYSKDLEKRFETLQTANAYEIFILVKFVYSSENAARNQEKHLHRRFARHRVRGEWFKKSAVMRDIVLDGKILESQKDYRTPQEYAELEHIHNTDHLH